MTNPYLIEQPFVVSLSFGRTSAFMLRQILDAHGGKMPKDSAVIFENTGKERLETLDFGERLSLEWGVDITWLEYRTGEPFRMKEVNYATASRNGEPFDDLLKWKQMLPNVVMRSCSQWLKIKMSNRYARHVRGWKTKAGGYRNAVGLRYDEPRRVAKLKASPKSTPGEEPFAPMSKARHTLEDVMAFWQEKRGGLPLDQWLGLPKAERPGWDLHLRPDEGNCDLCYLKGNGKLKRIMAEHPEYADWWIEKEKQFAGTTRLPEAARFRKNAPSYEETRRQALELGLFDGIPDDDTPDCRCTD